MLFLDESAFQVLHGIQFCSCLLRMHLVRESARITIQFNVKYHFIDTPM